MTRTARALVDVVKVMSLQQEVEDVGDLMPEASNVSDRIRTGPREILAHEATEPPLHLRIGFCSPDQWQDGIVEQCGRELGCKECVTKSRMIVRIPRNVLSSRTGACWK
jgi:hypothetical protein